MSGKLETLTRLTNEKVLAIVRVETKTRAKEIADGCIAGGVNILEISYTLPNASEIINYLCETYSEQALLVGAGTVIDATTARLAILAGAKFIIAPNYSEEVARMCNLYMIPYMPGCTSMTEATTALEMGASMIKAFPISSYYGPTLVKTMKTPLPYMPIMSSGGATIDNIAEWLENGIDCIGIGTLLTKGTSSEIAENARKIRHKIVQFKQNRMKEQGE